MQSTDLRLPPRNLGGDADVSSILVIDDERMIRDLVRHALTRLNYRVETAEDAREGIEKFDAGRFDLVITDICMPGSDGQMVLHHVRRSKKKAIPVIGVSGTPWLLQNVAFDKVLAKPFSIKHLVDTARSLTGADQAPASGQQSVTCA